MKSTSNSVQLNMTSNVETGASRHYVSRCFVDTQTLSLGCGLLGRCKTSTTELDHKLVGYVFQGLSEHFLATLVFLMKKY